MNKLFFAILLTLLFYQLPSKADETTFQAFLNDTATDSIDFSFSESNKCARVNLKIFRTIEKDPPPIDDDNAGDFEPLEETDLSTLTSEERNVIFKDNKIKNGAYSLSFGPVLTQSSEINSMGPFSHFGKVDEGINRDNNIGPTKTKMKVRIKNGEIISDEKIFCISDNVFNLDEESQSLFDVNDFYKIKPNNKKSKKLNSKRKDRVFKAIDVQFPGEEL